MNDGNHTGNAQKLPLAERARQGLLLAEPALLLVDVLALEHPTDRAARLALGAALRAAVNFGDLPVSREQRTAQIQRKESTWRPGDWTLGNGDPPTRIWTETQSTVVEYVTREDYRRWRAQCPATLLSEPPLSQIKKWLGEPPTIIPARLPLAERALQGLLLSEPTLLLSEVLELEHPDDPVRQAALQAAIETALRYGGLHSSLSAAADGCLPADEFLERESYQQWRAQCPATLLSDLSKIGKWLGATPMPVESLPESLPVESSLPVKLRPDQQDKLDCQKIARALWAEHPDWRQAEVLAHPRIAPYSKQWPGKNTVPGWLSEIDPRPKARRRGRPARR